MTTNHTRSTLAQGLVGGLLGGIMAFIGLAGPPARAKDHSDGGSGAIRAQEFQLVDETGRLRASLGFSAQGEPHLTMLDRRGAHVVWLGLAKDSGLAIRDNDGKTRLVLTLDQAGEPSLVFRDRQQRTRSFRPE